jgi:transposase
MLLAGEKPGKVAELVAVGIATIYKRHRRWHAEVFEGLVNKPKNGRIRKATEVYCQILEEILSKGPGAFGYDFNVWTVEHTRSI